MEVPLPVWRRLELWLAVALLGVSLVCAGLTAHAMATTSLSTDEFGTIGTFSSRGPLRVLTDYRAPKNHIFFNLLNSLLPGRDSFDPARARALSILATLLTGALIAGYAARRGQLFEGAALVAIWSLAPETLTLSMEARGYGFLGLFAVLTTIATLEYTRSGARSWLFLLGGASAFGVYTIPSFLLFAGPLLLLLWLAKRNRETFFTGAAAGALILLLYAPVLSSLANAFSRYQVSDEAEFSQPASLWKAVRLYLWSCSDPAAAALLVGLLLAPFALSRWLPAGRKLGPLLIAGACAAYFSALLMLRTPPLRISAFGFLPAAMAGLFVVGLVIRQIRFPAAHPVLFIAAAATLLFVATRTILRFDFLPAENWSLAGKALDAAFPESTRFDFARFAKYLDHTLPRARERAAGFDPAAFVDGSLVVVDAGNKWVDPRRFRLPAGLARIVEWRIPGRIRDMVFSFHLPAGTAVDGAPPPLGDADSRSGVPVPNRGPSLRFTPPPDARALVVLLNRAVTARTLIVQASQPDAFLAGDAVVLPLKNASEKPVEITLRSPFAGLIMTEAWIVR